MQTEKFEYETELVESFKRMIDSFCDDVRLHRVAAEFDYRSGRTDLVALSEKTDIFSFEAKLKDWRHALHQAYRSTSFSHYSYVVLPATIARKAAVNAVDFKRRSVGLCGVTNSRMEIMIGAGRTEPFQRWITDNARQYIEEEGYDITGNERSCSGNCRKVRL